MYNLDHYLYEIVNRVNGMKYFGASKDPAQRFKNHQKYLINGTHTNSYLQNAFNKYGASSFEYNIIGMAENEQYMAQDEMAWIWRAYPNCYNYLLGHPDSIFTTHRSAPPNVLAKPHPRPSLKGKKKKNVKPKKQYSKAERKRIKKARVDRRTAQKEWVRKLKGKKKSVLIKPDSVVYKPEHILEEKLNAIINAAREELN